MKNIIMFICSVVMLLSACDKDDYNKNEFRYVADGVRLSAPDESFRIASKYPAAYITWTDSSKKGIEIYSDIMKDNKFYHLHIVIDSLKGKGVYSYPEVKVYILKSDMSGTYFSASSRTDLTGELNLNYLNVTNGAAGYFHFMCEDTVRTIRIPVANGRFNLKWLAGE